jgi:hypothetical protein
MPQPDFSTPSLHVKVQLLASVEWLPFELVQPEHLQVGVQVVDLGSEETLHLEVQPVSSAWFTDAEIDTLRAAYGILHRQAEAALHQRPYQLSIL